MDFPTTEPDVMALLQKMLDGLYWHAADFPKVNRMPLITKRSTYTAMKHRFVATQSQLRIAVKATEEKFQELKQVMKICLQKSEVGTAANPEKLTEIGWGPKGTPQPAQLPGQPTDLSIIAINNQTVKIQWEKPEDNQPIRNYVIERRQQTGEGIGRWSMIQISYTTQITLRNQPLGKQLEYRIRAANTAGTGPFSNTVSVIL